jgi:hypothetical protein
MNFAVVSSPQAPAAATSITQTGVRGGCLPCLGAIAGQIGYPTMWPRPRGDALAAAPMLTGSRMSPAPRLPQRVDQELYTSCRGEF